MSLIFALEMSCTVTDTSDPLIRKRAFKDCFKDEAEMHLRLSGKRCERGDHVLTGTAHLCDERDVSPQCGLWQQVHLLCSTPSR